MKLTNINIYGEDGYFHKGSLCIEGKDIVSESIDSKILDGKGCYAIPGLIDIHFHGCDGYDFCEGTQEAIQKIAEYQLLHGITSICPATMTLAEEDLSRICETAGNYKNRKGAILRGINMEGPFISEKKKGAQSAKHIKMPNVKLYRDLQTKAKGLIKLLDLACEEAGAMALIDELKEEVRISLAHTTADYETASLALAKGAKHITHMYNAMPAYTQREPGVVGAAFDATDCMVELIGDGVHVHPSVIRATYQMFGENRICLISDSMMATGMPDGDYMLGGQKVIVRDTRAMLTDGTLAGSVTDLMDVMRYVVKIGVPLEKVVKTVTMNPAKAIGIYEQVGSLTVGKRADILLLNHNLKIKQIIFQGNIQ